MLRYQESLERLGIDVSVRVVDAVQYENRLRNWEFDIVIAAWDESLTPGNEQRDYWGSRAANTPGSRNMIGIADQAIDALIDRVVFATDRDELVAAHTSARSCPALASLCCTAMDLWQGPHRAMGPVCQTRIMPVYGLSAFPAIWWWDADAPQKQPPNADAVCFSARWRSARPADPRAGRLRGHVERPSGARVAREMAAPGILEPNQIADFSPAAAEHGRHPETLRVTPDNQAPGMLIARLDRIPVWSLPGMFVGIIGVGFLFTFYDIFDINVSFIQTSTQIVANGFALVDGVGHLGGGVGVLLIAPLIPRIGALAAMLLIGGFLVLAAIIAQFGTATRSRMLEEVSP